MIDSYWDLYLAYLRKCVRDNDFNDVDPHHYEMEWNHTLPRCIFGDLPFGQWLTKKQHAIASALQTLTFKRSCLFGWHKYYLPNHLYNLSWPFYIELSRKTGKYVYEKGIGIHSEVYRNSKEYMEVRSKSGEKNGPKNGLTTKSKGVGIFSKESRQKNIRSVKKVKSKRVKVIYPDGGKEFYPSAQETSRMLGISQNTVSKSARDLTVVSRGDFKGFSFRYE